MNISKTQIKEAYNNQIQAGVDDWQARTNVINDMFNNDFLTEDCLVPGEPEYYFTIQTIWNLCGK